MITFVNQMELIKDLQKIEQKGYQKNHALTDFWNQFAQYLLEK